MTQNSLSEEGLSPDEVCLVCSTTRENHGDKNHVFNSVSDDLVPIRQGDTRRQEPPKERPKTLRPEGPDLHLAFATLVEVLAEKDILNTKDVIRIFGGNG